MQPAPFGMELAVTMINKIGRPQASQNSQFKRIHYATRRTIMQALLQARKQSSKVTA